MKSLLSLAAALCLAASLSAQDHVGTWTASGQTPEGQPMQVKVTFNQNGTLAVDLGSDGSVDITGKFTVSGEQITFQADPGQDRCTEKGVYKYRVEGDEMLMEAVSEPCADRRPPARMTRAK